MCIFIANSLRIHSPYENTLKIKMLKKIETVKHISFTKTGFLRGSVIFSQEQMNAFTSILLAEKKVYSSKDISSSNKRIPLIEQLPVTFRSC